MHPVCYFCFNHRVSTSYYTPVPARNTPEHGVEPLRLRHSRRREFVTPPAVALHRRMTPSPVPLNREVDAADPRGHHLGAPGVELSAAISHKTFSVFLRCSRHFKRKLLAEGVLDEAGIKEMEHRMSDN